MFSSFLVLPWSRSTGNTVNSTRLIASLGTTVSYSSNILLSTSTLFCGVGVVEDGALGMGTRTASMRAMHSGNPKSSPRLLAPRAGGGLGILGAVGVGPVVQATPSVVHQVPIHLDNR